MTGQGFVLPNDLFSNDLLSQDLSLLARRRALVTSGVALSAAAIALLGGRDALAAGAQTSAAEIEADMRILYTALGAEHEAVAAYQVGAESGLLAKDVLGVAVAFQGHHKEHAAAIAATVQKLGGKADPLRAVPGTTMGYAGVKDPRERTDLIAWLRQASAAGKTCTTAR